MKKNPSELLWCIPLLMLWAFFFVVGLFPSPVVARLEQAGWIAWEPAPTTSPTLITLAFAGYMAWFAYARCRETGQESRAAKLRASYAFVLGVIAFVDFPFWLLISMPETVTGYQRYILYLIGPVKICAWLFLYSTVLRYYGSFTRADDAAFAKLAPDHAAPEESPESTAR